MAFSILPPFTVIKVAIMCAAQIGTSFGPALTCSIIRILWLKFQLTLCKSTHVLTLRSTTHHYCVTSLHTLTQNQNTSICIFDKRSWVLLLPPPFFSFSFWGPFEIDSLFQNLHLLLFAMAFWFSCCQWSSFTPKFSFHGPFTFFFSTPSMKWLHDLVKYFWVA